MICLGKMIWDRRLCSSPSWRIINPYLIIIDLLSLLHTFRGPGSWGKKLPRMTQVETSLKLTLPPHYKIWGFLEVKASEDITHFFIGTLIDLFQWHTWILCRVEPLESFLRDYTFSSIYRAYNLNPSCRTMGDGCEHMILLKN